MEEEKLFTCKNPSCNKTFNEPLKTLNLQQNPTEPYLACPFCLTRIDGTPLNQAELPPEDLLPEKVQPKEEPTQDADSSVKAEKVPSCQFHLGYLSERGEKDQIPEGCLVCKSIVDCMLKKMR